MCYCSAGDNISGTTTTTATTHPFPCRQQPPPSDDSARPLVVKGCRGRKRDGGRTGRPACNSPAHGHRRAADTSTCGPGHTRCLTGVTRRHGPVVGLAVVGRGLPLVSRPLQSLTHASNSIRSLFSGLNTNPQETILMLFRLPVLWFYVS